MFGIGKYIFGIGGLALALSLAWGARVDHLRAGWKSKYEVTAEIASFAVVATRRATGDAKLKFKDVPDAISRLSSDRQFWEGTATEQSARIDRMALDTARLKRLNEQLRKKAEAAIKHRQTAIEKLEQQALDPGDRADCISQIEAANAALDIIYKEGL